jgi:hypothetical protein
LLIVAELPAETLDAPGRVHELLLAGVERMAAEQSSTWISGRVERVSMMLPQAQMILAPGSSDECLLSWELLRTRVRSGGPYHRVGAGNSTAVTRQAGLRTRATASFQPA